MKRLTKYVLIAAILVVGICFPTIVILEIVREGSYWLLLYLVWGAAIMLYSLLLLKSSRKEEKASPPVGWG